MFLVFVENHPKKFVSSCFGLDSALKTIDAQMFFWSVFFKTHKKVIGRQTRHLGCFWWLITFFFCVFSKILKMLLFKSQISNLYFCVCFLLFLKLKQKKNMKKYFFMVFISKLKNALFWGSTNFFQFFFFSFSF